MQSAIIRILSLILSFLMIGSTPLQFDVIQEEISHEPLSDVSDGHWYDDLDPDDVSPEDFDCLDDYYVFVYEGKQALNYKLEWNDFPHEYLSGYFKENGECVIRGIKLRLGIFYDHRYFSFPADLVIPDEIDGHPVTEIASGAFSAYCNGYDTRELIESVTIGDNVRVIQPDAFDGLYNLKTVKLGKNVETIMRGNFSDCGTYTEDHPNYHSFTLLDWGDSIKEIYGMSSAVDYPPLPPTVEKIWFLNHYPKDYVIPASVKEMISAEDVQSLVILSRDMVIPEDYDWELVHPSYCEDAYIYCYAGSTAQENAEKYGYPYYLIDEDSLLLDGEAAPETITLPQGTTEDELRARLSVDGEHSEIVIDGTQDGVVCTGTTVTLMHTAIHQPGKVYTVAIAAAPEVTSDSATVDNANGVIYGVALSPTATELADNLLCVHDGAHLEFVYDDHVGTGTVIRVVDNDSGAVETSYSLVIFGDLNGDGVITAPDLQALKNQIVNGSVLAEGSAAWFAADLDANGIVNTYDLFILKQLIVGSHGIDQRTRELT